MTVIVKQAVKHKGKYFKLVENTERPLNTCDACIFESLNLSVLTEGCNKFGGNCGIGVFHRATRKEYLLAKLQGVAS